MKTIFPGILIVSMLAAGCGRQTDGPPGSDRLLPDSLTQFTAEDLGKTSGPATPAKTESIPPAVQPSGGQSATPSPMPVPPAGPAAGGRPFSNPAGPPAGNPNSADTPSFPGGNPVEATADTVGTKGKDYGGGPVTEAVRQYFRQPDRIMLLKVQHALNLYSGFNGNYPRSHQEFMKEIVNSPMYAIKLPELPPGDEYFYDAKQKKLMIRRKAR